MNKTAIYPGSFDPFTNGHLDIVRKAANLFDKVYILIGINSKKEREFPGEDMKCAIEETLRNEAVSNCEVCVFDGLVAEFAKTNNVGYMIRGLRNVTDYNYEENIAHVNELINPSLEYVYFRAKNIAVSSSMVRELNFYGKSIDEYVPAAVAKVIHNKW